VKPRIHLWRGIWSCVSVSYEEHNPMNTHLVMGFGYSPKAAYDDWKEQQK
jgi:hypothetical protein